MTKVTTSAYELFHSHPVVSVSNVTVLKEDLIKLKFSSINFMMHTGVTPLGFIFSVKHNGNSFLYIHTKSSKMCIHISWIWKSQNIHLSKSHSFLKLVIFLCFKC